MPSAECESNFTPPDSVLGTRHSVLGTLSPGTFLAAGLARMGNLLWAIIVILVILWLAGFAMHVGGSLIHVLLVIAVIVLIFQIITGRRAV